MADSYTVGPGDSAPSIAKQQGVSLQGLQAQNPGIAENGVKPGDTVSVPPAEKKGDLTNPCETCKCKIIDLKKPYVIATAEDDAARNRGSGGTALSSPSDPDDTPMRFGDDATFGNGTSMPNGQPSVGSDEGALKSQMNALIPVFAGNDSDGNAQRMFDKFQTPNKSVEVYEDPKLDKEVEGSVNFKAFSDRTLDAPGTIGGSTTKKRIHQLLRDHGWDINTIPPKAITDLGILSLNDGSRPLRTGDWANGLGLMVNGVQYVFVHVTKYHYDSCKQQYTIELEFHLYDIFGIDSTDMGRFGSGGDYKNMEGVPVVGTSTTGISSWWQLQHQKGYAPLLTKIVAKRHWTVSTAGQ
jgi:hypothetical protein